MNAARVFILATSLCLPAQLGAVTQDPLPNTLYSEDYPIEGSTKLYFRDLFALTECMVENDTDEVKRLMAERSSGPIDGFLFGQIAKRNGSCLTRGTQMRSNPRAFRGGLASALIQRKYAAASMPDYSNVSQVFGQRNPEEFELDERIAELHLIIGECVFRRNSDGVLGFLRTKLYSSDSRDAYGDLVDDLTACAPDGIVEDVEPEQLRGLLAQAGYYVDLSYETDKAGAG